MLCLYLLMDYWISWFFFSIISWIFLDEMMSYASVSCFWGIYGVLMLVVSFSVL